MITNKTFPPENHSHVLWWCMIYGKTVKTKTIILYITPPPRENHSHVSNTWYDLEKLGQLDKPIK